MSEAEQIDNEEAVEVKPEVKETPKASREDYDKAQEEKARKDNWVDFDEYVAQGKDPSGWKPAAAFNLFKDMRGVLTRKEQEFNSRLEGVQKLAVAQLAAQREELVAKRDAAIEVGDVKQVHSIEKQMNSLNQQQPQIIPPEVNQLNEWNAANQWVTEKTPKAAFARELWTDLQSKNVPIPFALQTLEAEVAKHFPASKPQPKAHIPETEKGAGAQGFGKKTSQAVTMDSLTEEERYIYRHSKSMWKDDKEFLQSVSDSRKAAGGK